MTTAGAKERGGCLTVYLVLVILLNLFALFGAFTLSSGSAQLAAQGVTFPSWYLPATVLDVILVLVGAFGAWTWKKWGVYLLIANVVLGLITSVLAGQVGTGVVSAIIAGAVLWYVLKDKWPLFE